MFKPNKNSKELKIKKRRNFIVMREGKRISGFKKGDILKLIEDDDSLRPLFKRKSDDLYQYFFWEDLDYEMNHKK